MAVLAMTHQGQVQGREKDGALLFAGIPYAAPPVGPLRFRPPQPPLEWSGTRDATRFSPVSWQPPAMMGGLLGGPTPTCDEDCLTLNVATPGLDGAHRPVMVWIHGGGFTSGSSATPWYNGARFAQHGDVVVVSINYRLGVLGFLHLADVGGEAYASSGLNGILDQVAALEWVRENIEAFGGDPGNVTIFGESAGGMSVGTLLGLPRAQGLFHQAILQSGAAHNLVTAPKAAAITESFLDTLGRRDIDSLLAAEPQQLLDAQVAATATFASDQLRNASHDPTPSTGVGRILGLPFQPVLDGVELPQAPLAAMRDGLSADVAVMVGSNLDEWHLFHLAAKPMDDERLVRTVDRVFGDAPGILDVYRRARPGADANAVWCAIMTDVVFRLPAVRVAETQAEHQPDHTYSYRFTWPSRAFDGKLGSCHALEIPFVFDNLDRAGAAMFLGDGPTPAALASAMHESWWRFATSRDPNHDAIPHWAPYDTAARATMNFDDTIEALADPASDERQVWDALI